jgi:nucleoside-triphosphatase THEP1
MLILWTGPKHSGKTTSAAGLAQAAGEHGFAVAGLLAYAVYRDGQLFGFDACDLRTGARAPLAVRKMHGGQIGPFHFLAEGVTLGSAALGQAATHGADLVIVDEFGPLELASQGWRPAVDSLISAGPIRLLLVVREELAAAVQQLYADVPSRQLAAAAPESVHEVIRMLADHHVKREMRWSDLTAC